MAQKQAAKRATPKVQRKRARARQVYLSKEEDAIFSKMLQRYEVNASELVRDWLWRAEAQFSRRRGKGDTPTQVDPRQLNIEGAVS